MIALCIILIIGYLFTGAMALCGKKKLKFTFRPIDLEKLGKKGK